MTVLPLALDTSAEKSAKYFELLRALTDEQRVAITVSLCTGLRRVVEAGIRSQYPHATADEIRARLTVKLYGPDVARRLHGWVAEGE